MHKCQKENNFEIVEIIYYIVQSLNSKPDYLIDRSVYEFKLLREVLSLKWFIIYILINEDWNIFT